jgi:hypothetical protein
MRTATLLAPALLLAFLVASCATHQPQDAGTAAAAPAAERETEVEWVTNRYAVPTMDDFANLVSLQQFFLDFDNLSPSAQEAGLSLDSAFARNSLESLFVLSFLRQDESPAGREILDEYARGAPSLTDDSYFKRIMLTDELEPAGESVLGGARSVTPGGSVDEGITMMLISPVMPWENERLAQVVYANQWMKISRSEESEDDEDAGQFYMTGGDTNTLSFYFMTLPDIDSVSAFHEAVELQAQELQVHGEVAVLDVTGQGWLANAGNHAASIVFQMGREDGRGPRRSDAVFMVHSVGTRTASVVQAYMNMSAGNANVEIFRELALQNALVASLPAITVGQ